MKSYMIAAATFLLFAGYAPDSNADCSQLPDLVLYTVSPCGPGPADGCVLKVKIKNNSRVPAGRHLTYVEINEPGVAEREKPQSQCSLFFAPGETSKFVTRQCLSVRQGANIDLDHLVLANVVVRVDAKNMVNECNENNNTRSRAVRLR